MDSMQWGYIFFLLTHLYETIALPPFSYDNVDFLNIVSGNIFVHGDTNYIFCLHENLSLIGS